MTERTTEVKCMFFVKSLFTFSFAVWFLFITFWVSLLFALLYIIAFGSACLYANKYKSFWLQIFFFAEVKRWCLKVSRRIYFSLYESDIYLFLFWQNLMHCEIVWLDIMTVRTGSVSHLNKIHFTNSMWNIDISQMINRFEMC